MSALLALERFIDHMLENWEIPARTIFEMLLRDCHNLAVPGLLVGFLTRHPDHAGELLDPFLEHPEIWHLETSRVVGEHFHVRDPRRRQAHRQRPPVIHPAPHRRGDGSPRARQGR